MAQQAVLLDDASMQCARCGTENTSAAKFCVSCGAVLAATGEALRVATLEEPPVTVPEWVFPGRVTEKPVPAPRIPSGRIFKFIVLTIFFLGILLTPGWAIWSTSTALRQVGIGEFFRHLPTCEQSARAAGQDPEVCADPDIKARFDIGTQQVKAERNRFWALSALGAGALFLATFLLLLAAGISPWWTLGTPFAPLNLIIWFWALWRVSAWPVRYWEHRST